VESYLDYFSAMVDEKGLLKRGLRRMMACTLVVRYKLMAPLAEAAIHNALEAPKP